MLVPGAMTVSGDQGPTLIGHLDLTPGARPSWRFVIGGSVFGIVVLFALAYGWLFGTRTNHESPKTENSNDILTSTEAIEKLNQLQTEVNKRALAGNNNVSDLKPERDALMNYAQTRVDAVNREPGQEGYSIEVRREAAYQTLVQKGTDPEEARLEVEAMESRGLLPDPPRQP